MAGENTLNFHEQGGKKWVVGGELDLSAGTLQLPAGALQVAVGNGTNGVGNIAIAGGAATLGATVVAAIPVAGNIAGLGAQATFSPTVLLAGNIGQTSLGNTALIEFVWLLSVPLASQTIP